MIAARGAAFGDSMIIFRLEKMHAIARNMKPAFYIGRYGVTNGVRREFLKRTGFFTIKVQPSFNGNFNTLLRAIPGAVVVKTPKSYTGRLLMVFMSCELTELSTYQQR